MKTRTFIATLVLGLTLGLPLVAQGAYIDALDREWRPLTETTNFTGNQVDAICDNTTFLCSGSIGSTDLTGWTWASLADVNTLFTEITGYTFTTPTTYYETGDTWATDAIAELGNTRPESHVAAAYGWTSTNRVGTINNFVPHIQDFYDPSHWDTARTSWSVATYANAEFIGVWLHRPAETPEPSALLLLGSGLFGLGLLLYRRNQ